MRTGGWILLIISFVIGVITARSIAYFFLNTKPIEVIYTGPTVKILIAQKEIPLGTEITAEYVAFKDVPVNEIPEQAIVDFMQVYRRRPAYPLISGCPICEDLLLQNTASNNRIAEYLPVGSQIVSLEIGQLRVGNNVMEMNEPLTQFVAAGGKVDIRCVPQQTETSEYIRLKNLVLDKYSAQENSSETANESGRIVLENVSVYNLNVKKASAGGKKIQNISFLLENGQAEKLAAAARGGRLRVVLHREGQTTALQINNQQTKVTVELDTVESTESPVLQNSVLALTADLQVQPQDSVPQDSVSADIIKQQVLKQPVRLLDSAVNSIPEPEVAAPEVAVSNNVIERHNEVSFVSPKIEVSSIKDECRNDAAVSISLPVDKTAVKTVSMTSEAVITNKRKASGVSIQVGLPSIQQNGYSPFLHSSAKPQEVEESETLSEPLPLKAARFK